MSTELATNTAANFAMVESAIEKGIDPQKILDFLERVEKNQAAAAFGRAITNFQKLCPRITKDRTASIRDRQNPERSLYSYGFASFDDIDKVIRPLLVECGLAISFSTEPAQSGIKITCRVRHGIHFEDSTLTVPVPAMNVNDTQRMGAALSYAKRYAICAALNIVVTDEDSDGSGLDCVTEAQAREIKDLVEKSGTELKRFLTFARAESIDKIARHRYKEILELLKKKGSGK